MRGPFEVACGQCRTLHDIAYPCPVCGPSWMRRSPILPPPAVRPGARDASAARAVADALRTAAGALDGADRPMPRGGGS